MMLTIGALKLMTADTGPHGPSFSARVTNNSARAHDVPMRKPDRKVSASIYKLSGTFIMLTADKMRMNIAHTKSISMLYLKKFSEEQIRVQYFAQFIFVPSMNIAMKASITIIRKAFCYFSAIAFTSTIVVKTAISFLPKTESDKMRIPVKQLRDPITCQIVSLSL